MPGHIGKAIKFARTPAGRKVLAEAIRVARSEEGRKLIAQARKVATSPEGKRLLAQATEHAKQRAKAWQAIRERFNGGKRP
jgi:sensor histidine kinase regulating citrate/malate metabolism